MTADFQSGGRADRLCLMAVDPQPDQWWLDDPLPGIGSSPFRRGERTRAYAGDRLIEQLMDPHGRRARASATRSSARNDRRGHDSGATR